MLKVLKLKHFHKIDKDTQYHHRKLSGTLECMLAAVDHGVLTLKRQFRELEKWQL